MAKCCEGCKKYFITKEVETDLSKKEIKTWEKDINEAGECWKVKRVTIEKLEE